MADHPGDDVVHPLGELFVDHLPLGFAQALQDHLLGGLGGDAAGLVGEGLHLQFLTNGHVPADGEGVGEGDFRLVVLHHLHYGLQGVGLDIPGVGIEFDGNVHAIAVAVLLKGGNKRGPQWL